LKFTSKYDNIFYTNDEEKKKRISKYSGLAQVISLNILGHHYFKESERALHFFRMYDVEDQKYTQRPNRYVEIYFELKKRNDKLLSKNLQAWRHFMLTGIALQGSPSYIKEAAEMLKISNLTKDERRLHDIYEKNRQKQLHREWYVMEKTVEKTKLETAKSFLSMGFSIGDVAKGTGLDYRVVSKLA